MSGFTIETSPAQDAVQRPGREQAAGPVAVLLISTSGGHLVQLSSLREAWRGYSTAWVTDDSLDARSVLAGERVYYASGPAERSAMHFVRNLRLARRLLAELEPKVVVTTGAAICVPFVWIARLRGIRVCYIESITRIEKPSLTCRLVRPAANRMYVQWPDLANRVRGSIYVGSVFPSG